ncbi:MAG: autotransporter-associated beta strand repeat-containing protein [Bacteroidaceae bacterium]|nr:autotransporter-associated beta strand repeat-containing protein [Bacteroidaceae bacterium]
MRRHILSLALLLMAAVPASAQRKTDILDRGLVAVPANANGASGSGNFVSWKVFGEEYYDVTYNLYCNGTLLKEGLRVSCFSHSGGTATSRYQVAAVVRGVEQEKSAEVTRWSNGYKDIAVKAVTDRAGQDATAAYIINDISLGDVTGDGVPEFIVKRNFTGDILASSNKTRFHHYECYTLAGERLWSIDLGPNMMAGPDEQWDIVAYDWDQDGKAECIMRGANNMIIHTATGHDIQIGNMNYYAPRTQYTCEGDEYLLYLNGATAEPYGWDGQTDKFTPMAYPLKRYETGEAQNLGTWGKDGDGGHRSTKHYFGAPFLDGRKASIFLGRGCYTQHKMCALDVDPATHALTQRWYWKNNNGWNDPWFGNGFHNFAIGDVDWDGRDEIVFGSMIIDDNGKGLCTTGLGHGDAQHSADLDPYRHGNEQFNCNEDDPACTYWNATTGKIYYRFQSGSDDGRALAGNFSNAFPGSMGRSTQTGLNSLTADKVIDSGGPATGGTNDALFWSHLNQRIYWDGDLCDEVLDSPGTEREAAVYKPGGGRLFTSSGCQMNNDSKNNPCALADIFGDWREEIVVRADGNTKIRIITTAHPTTYRIPTLWHDHQYRNAMVWQCVGYNQPPHKSYFLGQLEGITVAPPPLTMTGRTEIANGGTISAANNGQTVIVCETANTSVAIADGAAPAVAIFNVPTWVQGTNSNILNGTAQVNTETYTCTVTGGALGGAARLVKQGDGILTLPAVAMQHTAGTDIWAGTLNFDGTLLQSSLWLNRFAELNSKGQFRSIKADYAAIVRPGGADSRGTITTDSLTLGFGSRLVMDLYSEGTAADAIQTRYLSIDTKLTGNWLTYGPKYLAPVVEVVAHKASGQTDLAPGTYRLFSGVEVLKGKLTDIIIEGLGTSLKASLQQDGTDINLVISEVRTAADITWTGAESTTWEFAGAGNFALTTAPDAGAESFVSGDKVRFTDAATKTNVSIKGDIEADSIIVDATKAYTFSGTGAIVGASKLVKRGTGKLTIGTANSYTGGTLISGGTLAVSSLSNANQATGNTGAVATSPSRFIIENGAELNTTATVTQGSPILFRGTEGGVVNTSADLIMNAAMSGTTLTKRGTAWLKQYANNTLQRAIVQAGAIQTYSGNPAATVELQGGALYDESQATTCAIEVPKGKTGTLYMTNTYYTAYANRLTGEGTFTYVPRNTVSRVRITGNWTAFEGTIKHTTKDIWLPLDMTGTAAKATLDIAEGCTVTNTAKAFTIGRVLGKGSLAHPISNFQSQAAISGSNTWQVGNDDTDFTFAGTFTDGGGNNKVNFAKVGKCKMTATGASNHSGTTTVSAGELHITTTTTLGTGTLTVRSGATLSGNTATGKDLTNASVSIARGGTVQVGASPTSVTGVMRFGGKNVSFAQGSTLHLGVNKGASGNSTGGTSLQNIRNLTMNATISLYIPDDHTLAVGDEVILWQATNVTGTPTLESYYIAEGLYWDATNLAQGRLKVTSEVPVGIATINADSRQADAYTIDGRRVGQPTRQGVYVVGGRKVVVK